MPSPATVTPLDALVDTARPFLRGDLHAVDPSLPRFVAVLRSVGAGECWHKHGSFLSHLLEVYRVLKLWSVPEPVARCGLFHSAYSNSYVNLAIFDPSKSRSDVRSLIGVAAERLVHLFCIVNRQTLIYDDILFKYEDDGELLDHVREAAKRGGEVVGGSEKGWRRKINEVVPRSGLVVRHIKTGEEVKLSRRIVATFLLMTMVDFSDQLFGWQDELFENSNGRLEYAGNNPQALWPGNGKPGLWMNSISRMGAIYYLIVKEEENYMKERKMNGGVGAGEEDRDEDLELVIPPVFQNCTGIVGAQDQIAARDLYWEAICCGGSGQEWLEKEEGLLTQSIEKNPFAAEPRVVLANVYLGMKRFEEAEEEAERGLRLLLEWGSCWDLRMPWEGWVAWVRVLLMKAKEKDWPQTSWGILNLGLVK